MKSRELIEHCNIRHGDCNGCEYYESYCDVYMDIYITTPYLEDNSISWDENVELYMYE